MIAVGIRGSISSLLVFLVLCGCGKALPLDGDWIGDLHLKANAGQDPSVAVTLSKVSLHFSGTGRFELLYRGVFYKGEVKRNESDADLVVDTVINRSPDKSIIFKVKPTDGKMAFDSPEGEHAVLEMKVS